MTQENDINSEPLSKRLIVPVTTSMLEAITDYRFERRYDSKSEAVRKLIEAGLKAEGHRAKK